MQKLSVRDQVISLSKERIQFLSDGVFAIVMTILVLDIHVPQLDNASNATLLTNIFHLWPNILTFAFSFLVVAIFWLAHHNMFHYIKKVDRPFIWLNILYLLFVAILPFSSSLLAEYNTLPAAVIVYSIGLSCAGLTLYLAWSYAAFNRKLTLDSMTDEFIAVIGQRVLLAPIAFALCALLAVFYPRIAVILLFAIQIVYILPFRFLDKFWAEE